VSDVNDELFWDPKVDNTPIAVSADDGRITLRGTVGSLREKREAKVRRSACSAWSPSTTSYRYGFERREARRRRGARPRASGAHAGQHGAEHRRREGRRRFVGTLDVVDEIELKYPTPDAGDVKEGIKKAFKRNAKLDAGDLSVSTSNGTVTRGPYAHGQSTTRRGVVASNDRRDSMLAPSQPLRC
jgi:osmotically-inducible protein OsmY